MPVKAAATAILGPCVLLLAGCGSAEKAPPTTVTSDAYSCTGAGLARLGDLRAAVRHAVPQRASGPRVRDYCDGGLDAGVELTVAGTLDQVQPVIHRALGCGAPRQRPAATGRSVVMRCHVRDLEIQVTLSPYLPADDPHGPSTLGEATLVAGR
ncbi:MAG: hypothetical protein ACTHNS_01840 [Marmoricola sp.]